MADIQDHSSNIQLLKSTGAPQGKRVVIFIDDLNMPKLDTYGSQPPIELLRQYLDFDGLYDRETMTWKEIQ
ncbi:dynein heavy chain 6, axonemal, partial [Biomphalaria glabrata]